MEHNPHNYYYKQKYLKYKQKYLNLIKQCGGLNIHEIIESIKTKESLIIYLNQIQREIEPKLVSGNFLSIANLSTYDFSDDIDNFLLYFMYKNMQIFENKLFNLKQINL